MENNGPLNLSSSIRYESKNKEIRQTATVAGNNKSLLKSVCLRLQLGLAHSKIVDNTKRLSSIFLSIIQSTFKIDEDYFQIFQTLKKSSLRTASSFLVFII